LVFDFNLFQWKAHERNTINSKSTCSKKEKLVCIRETKKDIFIICIELGAISYAEEIARRKQSAINNATIHYRS